MNACEAYWWVYYHPKLVFDSVYHPWIEITPHMVNPETDEVDEDETKNTKISFWVESGPWFYDEQFNQVMSSHDYELDCGGDTWEDAVFALVEKVKEHYGDYDPSQVENDYDKELVELTEKWFNGDNSVTRIELDEI